MSTTTGGTKLSDDIIAAENSMRMSCNTVTILSPDDADISLPSSSPSSPPLSSSASSSSPSPRIALAYNSKEAAAVQQLFGLLAVNQFSTLKEYIAQTPEGERRDELLRTIVSMAIGSGTPLRLIYLFIVDELKDGSVDAFKPTSDATKMIEFYWELAGRKFLKDALMPTINQLAVVNKKLSFELDQSKLAPYELEDMPRHRALVIEHITQLVDKITSKEMVEKIPIPIKAILTQINQLGKERGKHYCGLVFFNRFIGCALADPIAYRLVPGQRFLTQRVRRNFSILASLLRSVLGGSQGVETALAGLTDVLRDLRPRLENFIDGALRSKSLDVGDRFVNEISSRPLNNLHKFILHNQQNILKQFKEEPVALEFFKGIGALAGYNTKWTQFTGYEVPTVSTSDPVAQGPEIKKIREAIKTWLDQKNEIAIFVGFVDKKKKNGQLVKRVLLIGFNRIATFKPTAKIARESNLLDLTLIKSPNTKEFQITTTGWTINGESEEVDHIIACARKAYDYSFTTIPVALKFKAEVQPASRLEVLTPHDRTTTEALVIAYKAACAYLNTPIKQSIITHVNQAYTDDFKLKVPNAKTFNLKHVYKHTIDTPTQAELEPLLFALRHNWYFDTLRIKNHKLERGLWGQVVDIMKYTVSITSLTLDNTNASKDGIAALAEAMMANKGLKLQSLCVANSPLGDRSAAPLMQYLSTHPNIHLLQKLNFTNLGLTATGLTSLANEALPKCTGLTYLNLTGNRLALSTDALVNWVITAKYLNTLILAGTGFKTRMVAPTIGASKSLTTLDLSNRRIIKRPTDQTALAQLAQSGSNIQTLNLDRTQLPAESLKDIATQQYTLQVSHNVLGLAGVQAIMSTHMLDYLKELRLDDTELGDEGVTALCTTLTNHPTLRLLSIGRGFKGSEGSKNRLAAVQSVAKMLQSVGVLEVFHMPGGTSTPYQLKGHMGTILAALHKNDILTDLDISNHAMVNQGAIALAKLIAENYTISSILWDGNGTGTLGFANVKNALKRNLSVRYMPVPIADIVSVHKDDRVPQPEQQKLSTLLSRIQTYLNRNSQL